MDSRWTSRLTVCCVFVSCFVGTIFSKPLLGEIPLEQQRNLAEISAKSLQDFDQVDRENALHAMKQLCSKTMLRACQETDALQQHSKTCVQARNQCLEFLDFLSSYNSALDLGLPEPLLESFYDQQKSSIAAKSAYGNKQRATSQQTDKISEGEGHVSNHESAKILPHSQFLDFHVLPNSCTDHKHEGIWPLLHLEGQGPAALLTRNHPTLESFKENSEGRPLASTSEQTNLGELYQESKNIRDSRQIKFDTFYPEYENIREPRQIKFGALYPEYENIHDPRQLKF